VTYGPILTSLAVKTFKYVIANYVVDHYAAVGPDDSQPTFATNSPVPGSVQASRALLLEIGLSQASSQFPVIQRTGRMFSPKITRIVIRMADDALLVIALKASIEDMAARVLAGQIADVLWRTPRIVMMPDPSHYIGPMNLDGLGYALPQPIYADRGLKRRRVFRHGKLI
jgi:hypothetical protein